MFRPVLIAAALSAVSISLPALAQDAKPPVAPDKKICKRVIATGSVMAKSTCHTKGEWDAMAAQAGKDRDRVIELERARNNVQLSR